MLETNLNGSIFDEIVFMLVGKHEIPYFLLKPLATIGYDSHVHVYEIEYDYFNDNNDLIGCSMLGNNKSYATSRYSL